MVYEKSRKNEKAVVEYHLLKSELLKREYINPLMFAILKLNKTKLPYSKIAKNKVINTKNT